MENSKDAKPAVELLWREHLKESKDYTYFRDQTGVVVPYVWGDKETGDPHWRVMQKHDIEQRADSFLYAIQRYKKDGIKACEFITKTCLPNIKRPLKETRDVSVACKNAMLFFREGGRIEARQIDSKGRYILAYDDGSDCRGFLPDVVLPVSIDMSRVKNGWYTPRSMEETEKGLWGRLITGLLPDKQDRLNFQELFGDLMSKKQRKAMPMLLGPADGGKSQVLVVAQKLITNHVLADFADMSGFEKEGWIGKRAILIDEAPKKLQSEDGFKRILGGAGTQVRRKFDTTVSIPASWKFLWCLNEMPVFSEKGGAIEARMRPFQTQVVPKEMRIEEIGLAVSDKELHLVLDWALEGLSRIEKRGRALRIDEMSSRSLQVLEDTRDETNPCRTWMKETGMEPSSDGSMISQDDLYNMFIDWCFAQGRKGHAGVSRPVFFRNYFGPAVVDIFGTDSGVDKKRYITDRKTGKRDYAHPVSFTNNPEALGKKQRSVVDDQKTLEDMRKKWFDESAKITTYEDPFQ